MPEVHIAEGYLGHPPVEIDGDAEQAAEEEPRLSFARRRHHAVPRAVSRPARRLGDRPRLRRGALVAEAHAICATSATDKHRTVDDTPAGGGPGMVLKPDVLAAAIDASRRPNDPRPRLLMSPRGTPLTQARVRALAAGPGAVIVCGRFEGVDERVIEARNLEEISIGDYVLAGGEVAAMVLLEAVVRLIPGVLGKDESYADESFENGVLEYPQYHPAADLRRPRHSGRADLRRPWQGREMAARAEPSADPRPPTC